MHVMANIIRSDTYFASKLARSQGACAWRNAAAVANSDASRHEAVSVQRETPCANSVSMLVILHDLGHFDEERGGLTGNRRARGE